MKIDAHLDIDVVALEQDDVVSLMLELTAPPAPAPEVARPPHTLVVVLDRSGSMSGERLHAAQQALLALVDRLDLADRLGVVVFDDEAQVVIPARPLADTGRLEARERILAIVPGGMTDLSSGYLRGLQEARASAGETGATVVVLSDGQANTGITDPQRLAQLAADVATHGVTTSTIGIGLGYDEQVLVALTEGGSGSHAFAERPEEAAVALAAEVEGLLSKTVQAASLRIRAFEGLHSVTVLNPLPCTPAGDTLVVELGDFYGDESRRVLITLGVPGKAALGLAQVAELELRYVELPGLVEHTVTLPVSVNVVPGDEAARRVPKPEVEQEKLLLSVQQAKRESEEALRRGDTDAARSSIAGAIEAVGCAPMASPELDEELTWFRDSLELLDERDASYNAKRMAASRSATSRGRRPRAPREPGPS